MENNFVSFQRNIGIGQKSILELTCRCTPSSTTSSPLWSRLQSRARSRRRSPSPTPRETPASISRSRAVKWRRGGERWKPFQLRSWDPVLWWIFTSKKSKPWNMLMTKFQVITNKYLEIRTLDFGSFVYNISTPPVHGWISVLAPNKVCNNQPSQCFFFLPSNISCLPDTGQRPNCSFNANC